LELDLPTVSPDVEDTIFDFLVDESGQWAHWSTRVTGEKRMAANAV